MFRIRRLGINSRHTEIFSVNRPLGYDCYLLLFVKTKAVFYLDDSEIISEPGTYVLFDINSPQKYGIFDDEYIDDWIQFESDENIYAPLNKPVCIGNTIDISGYIKLISDSFYRSSDYTCSTLLRAMISEVAEFYANNAYRSPHSEKLLRLRKEIYAYPEHDWKIKTMSEQIHISEPYFQELYKKLFGIACGTDVINARIETAKTLLVSSDMSVAEIGARCGYNSPVHFSRQFKRLTGISPIEYRQRRQQK